MFLIYGKPDCPWCDRAKDLLYKSGESFDYIDVAQDTAARNMIVDMGAKTVPQVFFESHHIGGFEALKSYLEAA